MTDALLQRAERGRPRGAETVLAAARAQVGGPSGRPDWPRRIGAAVAVAVVVLLVATAILAARRDGSVDRAPVDDGQVDTSPVPQIIEGPMFGAETGTTLIVTTGEQEAAIAIDLDGGTMRGLEGVTPAFDSNGSFDEIGVVQDRLVFTRPDDRLLSAPSDLGSEAVVLPGLPNGRTSGFNDIYTYFASGDSGRFWVMSGPIGDEPDRAFLAEERNLAGEVVTPAINLGRSRSVVGATRELVIVSVREGGAHRVELRDRASQEVVRVLRGSQELASVSPGFVSVEGERIVWTDGCAGCPLHVFDADTGQEREVPVDPAADLTFGAAVLSPDGTRLAAANADESRLAAIDLESGELWMADARTRLNDLFVPPVWSPDGEWLFTTNPLNDYRAELTAYRVGGAESAAITIGGFSAWSLVAVPRVAGPDPASLAPCGMPVAESCRPVAAVASAPTPSEEEVTEPADTALPLGRSDPAGIPVVVANGSGVAGAAGAVTERLIALGYAPGAPFDTTLPVEESPLDTVYFVDGFEGPAAQVAADLGYGPEALIDMSDSPPPVRPEDIDLVGVLVVLGSTPGGLADA